MKSYSDSEIQDLLMKHPFFKNPNHYYIRLITLMKYLKKKDMDVKDESSDIRLDRILMSIPGVKRIGNDRYTILRNR